MFYVAAANTARNLISAVMFICHVLKQFSPLQTKLITSEYIDMLPRIFEYFTDKSKQSNKNSARTLSRKVLDLCSVYKGELIEVLLALDWIRHVKIFLWFTV